MSNLNKKLTLSLVLLLVVMAFSSVFAANDYLMNLTVSYNGKALKDNEQIELFNTDTNRTLTITTDAKYVDDSLTIYVNRGTANGNERRVLSTGKKSATYTIPTDLREGYLTSFAFEAVANDFADNYVGNSNGFNVKIACPKQEDVTITANLEYAGATVAHLDTIRAKAGETITIKGKSNVGVKLVSYKWDNGNVYEVNGSSATITIPELGYGKRLSITAQAADGKWANSKTFTVLPKVNDGDPDIIHEDDPLPVNPDVPSYVDDDDDELIVEPWMKENDDLNKLAVSLRSAPYDDEEDRANKNIYALGERVVYYVDYKNGGKKIDKDVKLTLNIPLSYTVVSSDGGSVDTKNGNITWTFKGLDKEASGTKTVVVKFKSLGNSKSLTYKRITPMATIYQDGKKKDMSGVINLIVKDFDEEVKDEHEPYMYGDRNAPTFRPDDTITRAEGALVLTRIFGISTNYDARSYDFPDLDETYLEARRAIRAAKAYGLIEGFPDGNYYPNKTMTIGEFMTIIARQLELEEEEGFEVKEADELIKIYKDKNRIYYLSDNELYNAHWSAGYATLLCRLNMAPVEEKNTNLRLDNPITRAEVAQLVNFYLLRAPAAVTRSTTTKFTDVSRNHKLFGDIVEATRPAHNWSLTEEGTEQKED